ncbi:MAG: hypothetical protein H7305_05065 [Gemmatimonadaceae bacterium]|nr:hypothetical protein [Gemmatimonadaceae bacterium]
MSRTLRVQGAVFAVIAMCGVAMSLLLPRMLPQFELLGIAVLIAFVGVPHDALDSAFARQRFGLHTPRAWFVFSLGYVLLMLIVVALWWMIPVLFLAGFLYSARHILRTVAWVQFTDRRLAVGAVVAPMLGVACLGTVAWIVGGDVPLEPKVIQLIFVGLASVTVPHMLLIEPIRLVGWRDG